jgi:hypothetical protein
MVTPRRKTRRERGSGSIIALARDRYKLKISVTTHGKRLQKYKTVRGTLADAKRELRRITDGLAQPRVYVAPGDATIADFAETWYADTITPRIDSGLRNAIGARAAETYRKILTLYVTPGDRLGAVKVSALARGNCRLISALTKTPRQDGTAISAEDNNRGVPLAAQCSRRRRTRMIASNLRRRRPRRPEDRPAAERAEDPMALSLEQIATCTPRWKEGRWFAPIIGLMLYTGLRIGSAGAQMGRRVART